MPRPSEQKSVKFINMRTVVGVPYTQYRAQHGRHVWLQVQRPWTVVYQQISFGYNLEKARNETDP